MPDAQTVMSFARDPLRPGRFSWLAAAGIGLLMMAAVQTGSPDITGNDGYYHVRMAALLPELGFTQTFPWLRWTILYDPFVSHHYGFHVLLYPFAALAERLGLEPWVGGKIAACVAMAAIFGVFDRLLRRLGAPFPLLWILLLALVPWHFWLRMTYVRAPMAALPLLLLAVIWCMRGRVWLVLVLAFFFTQVYGGAVIFPLIPAGFCAAALLTGEEARRYIRQFVASLAGILLGLIISPYFPQNFSFFFTQIFVTGLAAPDEVGREWRSYESWALLQQAGVLAAVWLACLMLRLRVAVKASRDELGLLLVHVAFLLLVIKSRRFVEYWPVFALANAAQFAAVAWRARQAVRPLRIPQWVRPSAALTILLGGIANLAIVWRGQYPTHDLDAVKDAMTFLRDNSPAGSMVFTDDWDIFPICFYFNQHNTYAVGLDPEFTRSRYTGLWERYKKITRAELPARVPKMMRAEGEDPEIKYADIGTIFGAQFVLVAEDHGKFYKALTGLPDQFERVYPAEAEFQPPIAIFKFLQKPS